MKQCEPLDRSWDHFYNLEYDAAIAAFERAIAQDSTSPDLHNQLAQCIVFQETYGGGTLESGMVAGKLLLGGGGILERFVARRNFLSTSIPEPRAIYGWDSFTM